MFEILLPTIVLSLLVLIHQFSNATDFDVSLHLGRASSDFRTMTSVGLLLSRLNAYRTAIAFVPQTDFPEMQAFFRQVVEPVLNRTALPNLPDSLTMTFTDQEQLQAYLDDPDYGRVDEKPMFNTIMQGKELYTNMELPTVPHFEYHIRMNASASVEKISLQTVPDTRIAPVDIIQSGFDAEQYSKYVLDGFYFLQQFQDLMILNRTGAVYIRPWELGGVLDLDNVVQVKSVPFPTPPFSSDLFFRTIGETIGLFFTITFIWSVTRIVASLIEEKELKLREGMKIMGLDTQWLILSWISTYLVIFFLTALALTVIVCPILFSSSNLLVLFIFFFLFCCSTFAFGYLMSTLFNKSNVGSAFSAIIFLMIYFANEVVKAPGSSRGAKLIASLSPAVALAQGAATFGQFEQARAGVGFGNLFETYDGYSAGDAIVLLILDTVWIFLLGAYLEQVIPGEYGITKPWYFPLTCCCSQKAASDQHRLLLEDSIYDTLPDNETYTKVQPPAQNDLGKEGIKIRKLRRTFQHDKKEPFVAVHELSLDIYKNQVFVLLGHNGAGKTTTINMLTGLIDVTSGNVQILGRELNQQLPEIRKNMGYCPQHDLLYPTLSVREHLELYADIKGMTTDQVVREQMILDIIEEVGLQKDNKEHALSMTLSGGQKRKLSVAIALLNNSPVVLLDEPSTGMDVAAQRDLWKLIQSNKKNRVVLLTTHSMEEAEIGDRIAILAHSRLQCVGTSHFLKNAYGVGYTLTITKEPSKASTNTTQDSYKIHQGCTTRTGSAIAEYLLPKYPFLEISSDAGMEIGFKVRFEQSHLFPKLFDDIEANKQRLSIVSYGMSVTTLTEVFLTVGHGQEFIQGVHDRKQLTEDDDRNDNTSDDQISTSIDYSTSQIDPMHLTGIQQSLNSASPTTTDASSLNALQLPEKEKYSLEDIYGVTSNNGTKRQDMVKGGFPLFKTHFVAMFKKRFANSKRDAKSWVWQLLFPGILLLTSLLMVKLTNVDEYPSRVLTGGLYYDAYQGHMPYSSGPGAPNAEQLAQHLVYGQPRYVPADSLPPPIPQPPEPDFPDGDDKKDKKIVKTSAISFITREELIFMSLAEQQEEKEEILHSSGRTVKLLSDGNLTTIWGQFNALNTLFVNSYLHAVNPHGPTAHAQQLQLEQKHRIGMDDHPVGAFGDDDLDFNSQLANNTVPSITSPQNRQPHGPELKTDFENFLINVTLYNDYLALLKTDTVEDVLDGAGYTPTPPELTVDPPVDEVVPLDKFQTWLLENRLNKFRFHAFTINYYNPLPQQAPNVVTFNGSIHFNTTARDSLPVAFNTLSNALLRGHYKALHPDSLTRQHDSDIVQIGKNGDKEESEEDKKFKSLPSITVVSNPLPRTENEKLFVSSTVGIFIALSMAFVPSTFVGFLVKERAEKAKHLQIISGVSPFAYWVSTYVWDTLNFVFPFILSMIILYGYNMQALINSRVLIYTIASFWLFQLSVAPFVYCFSFLFDSHNAAQNLTLLLGFFLSVILLIASLIMSKLPSTMGVDKYLRWVYRLFPPFSFGESLITITFQNSGFNPDALWKPMICMLFTAILYFALLLVLESWSTDHQFQTWSRELKSFFARKIPCCRPKTISRGGVVMEASGDSNSLVDEEDIPPDVIENEEPDVNAERERILFGECDNSEYGVVLKGLRKVYASRAGQPPHVAVNNLYFAIPYGQCFGLLGANGAGKSTTMKLITGDETPSPNSGTALLGGFDLINQSSRVRQVLGYCPQFDALLPLLTAREHLELYARIKCVPEQYIKGLVNYMIDKLGLTHLQNNPAGTYSGGNKRKLSIGIALVGQPLVLLLDEPSSGVDPASRREIWRLISSTMKGRAVILVSHSMEECEALCQRIGIMTSGNLRVLNSAQQLKSKYGEGYQVITKSKDGQDQTLLDFFKQAFTGIEVVEQHGVNFTLKIPKSQNGKPMGFKDVFSKIENNKTSAGIESYSVSDTDLEHVFIGFVEEDNRRKREQRKRIELKTQGLDHQYTDISYIVGSPQPYEPL